MKNTPIIQTNTGIVIPFTKIISKEDLEQASALRSKLKSELTKITTEKDKVARPLLDAIAAERARFAPFIKKYEGAIDTISKMMTVYQTEQMKLQEKVTAKVESGYIKPETAIKKLADIEVGERVGYTTFRKNRVLKIVDEKLIPRGYLVINEKKLLEDLKQGIEVPGAVIDIELIPVG